MATTGIQRRLTGVVENFIGLWNRYYTQYLEGIAPEDITGDKENELLKFQGTMVEQLVPVLEIDEHQRFDIHDKVMSVINEVISLDLYTKMSEFQIKRVKNNWQDAMDELEKFYRFCDTYDPKIDKVRKITEVKKKNPFWDPTSGGMRGALARLTVSPVTFFQGLKSGVLPEGMGRFVFLTFYIPTVIIMAIVFLVNFEKAKAIGNNILIEAGFLTEGEAGLFPGLMIAATVFVGLLLIALTITIVFLILHYVIQFFLHIGFKLTGGKEDFTETQKAVTYGAAPFITAVTTPYAAILQIIGAAKVHRYPYFLAILGWIIGIALFTVAAFGVTASVFHFTGNLPSGEYLYVTSDTTLYTTLQREEAHSVKESEWFTEYEKKKGSITVGSGRDRREIDAYKVTYNDKDYYVDRDDVDEREFTLPKIPAYIIGRGVVALRKAQDFLNGVVEEYSN